MDIAIILALALVALAAALLAWAWRRNRPPCATCRHQYKRYEWSNGRTAYSCRLRRGKWSKLRIVQDIEDCPHWERRKHEKDD